MTNTNVPVLSVRNLTVEFPSRRGVARVLDDVSFEVSRGEILGLVGESGAGKSMTGAAIVGLLEPPGHIASGEVYLHEQRIDTLRGEAIRTLRGKRIGMVFQDPLTSLNPVYTVGRQLVETMRTHLPLSAEQARQRAIELLDEVGIVSPAERVDDYPHQFSGGMRQRVAIALALCAEPELIIADEPTTALDVSVQAQIIQIFRRLCIDHGVAGILITHDMGVIAETADRVAVMYKGKVVESGPVRQILDAPREPYTIGLMAAIPSMTQRVSRLATADGAGNIAPQHSAPTPTTPARESSELLRVEGLGRVFDVSPPWLARMIQRKPTRFVHAVDNVSFSIPRGKTFGLVGESGSGKSTVARMIVGLTRPSSGRILFEGQDVWQNNSPALRSRFQMIFQDPYASLNPRWRVDRIIAEPLIAQGARFEDSAVQDRIADLLRLVRLDPAAGRRYPHQFSGGQRQRIGIARALASRPEFIVCDEPTSALDVSVQAQVLNLMRDLQDELGLTYLLISHNLAVIKHMSDQIGVMQRGKLVELADTDTLFDNPQHAYTRDLLAAVPDVGHRHQIA